MFFKMNSASPIGIVLNSACFSIYSFQEVIKDLIVAHEIKLVL